MQLKVIRYQNYGRMNWGDVGEDDDVEKKKIEFYYCFFELNNGKIIFSQFEHYLTDGVNIHNDLDFFYTKKYKFGQDFWEWWESRISEPLGAQIWMS
jgi:hypothetical protein